MTKPSKEQIAALKQAIAAQETTNSRTQSKKRWSNNGLNCLMTAVLQSIDGLEDR
jgi:hypothetical protein